jgi:transcriptional regulator with XRE-family HTH domain
MSSRIPDPVDPDLTVGQRIQWYRERRGMSREVLGGLVGKNGRWVKAVERGEIGEPKVGMLLSIAETLRLADLSKLTGGQAMPMSMFRGPGHPALPAVRHAINAVSITASGEPTPLAHLQARLDAAWRARHSSPDHRTVLGSLLPELIRDAKHAVRTYEGADRRRALSLLAQIYNLAQFFIAYQPSADLLWRVVERSLMTAEESEDPHAFASAVWLAAQAHRDVGDFDAAEAVNREGLDAIRPRLDGGGDALRALWGALHHEMAYTLARTGRGAEAWWWWEQADEVAQSLPSGFYEPMTSFSRIVMGAHAVTVAVEARQGGEARRQARRNARLPIPSQPRRGRHLIEVARALLLSGDQGAALATLDGAYVAAPETIRYNGYARRMVREAAEEPGERGRNARDLADRIGMLVM